MERALHVTFHEIPLEETLPPQAPGITRAQQEAAAVALRVPMNRAHEVTRYPTITLPGLPICMSYVTYFSEVLEQRLRADSSSPRIGIMCENTETWIKEYGNAAAAEVLRSLLTRGRPPVRWAWLWHLEQS
jgi:hypothetical protein